MEDRRLRIRIISFYNCSLQVNRHVLFVWHFSRGESGLYVITASYVCGFLSEYVLQNEVI
jgi:hypothetical protein